MRKPLMILCLLGMLACQKSNQIDPTESLSPSVQSDNGEVAKAELAKALVKALQEKEVRAFIKTEALRQYDGDYDVVYALVKDKKLTTGQTFEQTLAKYAASTNVERWSQAAPLATIFVPTLSGFSAEAWNLDSQIPDVVIDDSHLDKAARKDPTTFAAFSADLRQYTVSTKKAPSFPVVVIKENERIIAKSKANSGAKLANDFIDQASTKTISENSTHSFYFIGNVNPNDPKKKSARSTSYSELPGLLIWNYTTGHVDSDRDFIYYYIAPSWGYNDGSLQPFSEHLRGFKLSSPTVLQSISSEWTEGYLEFHVMFSYMYRDGSMKTDLKVFYCTPSQLMDGNNNMLEYNPDVELNPWDMYRYGDEWKFTVLEHDQGGSTQTTISTKSTFGFNFEGDFTILKKGVKFGITGSEEKSSSQVVTITNEDKLLGDATFLFTYPVVVGIDQANDKWITRSVSTGSVDISIEPVATSAERPHPD